MSEKFGDWLPIDQAPKDGHQVILGFEDGSWPPYAGYYVQYNSSWRIGHANAKCNPSHFMFFPNNPGAEE